MIPHEDGFSEEGKCRLGARRDHGSSCRTRGIVSGRLPLPKPTILCLDHPFLPAAQESTRQSSLFVLQPESLLYFVAANHQGPRATRGRVPLEDASVVTSPATDWLESLGTASSAAERTRRGNASLVCSGARGHSPAPSDPGHTRVEPKHGRRPATQLRATRVGAARDQPRAVRVSRAPGRPIEELLGPEVAAVLIIPATPSL